MRIRYDSLGLIDWTLSNGIKVYLKPTDFKNDEILFQGFSPGGNSLISDSEYVPAATATAACVMSVGTGPIRAANPPNAKSAAKTTCL